MENKEKFYECRENSNRFTMIFVNGRIYEIEVGDADGGEWTLVNFKDFRNALEKVGYEIVQKNKIALTKEKKNSRMDLLKKKEKIKMKEKRCDVCGKVKKDVPCVINPYIEDVKNETVYENICCECYDDLCNSV